MRDGRTRSGRSPQSVALQVVAEVVLTMTALVLLYGAWELGWNDHQVAADQAAVAVDVRRTWDDRPATPHPPGHGTASPTGITGGDPSGAAYLGVLHLPRFGSHWQPRAIVEGVGTAELLQGIGHYPGSAQPGEVGNLALAGHRLTKGSALKQIQELRVGDAVVVETPTTWVVYRVTGALVVPPTRLDVIAPVPEQPDVAPTRAVLTLTTCHPLYSSRERFVVHADLVRTQPRTAGPPAELAVP